MGREIIRQESRKDSGGRSRLSFYNDVLNVLKENMVCKSNMHWSSKYDFLLDLKLFNKDFQVQHFFYCVLN